MTNNDLFIFIMGGVFFACLVDVYRIIQKRRATAKDIKELNEELKEQKCKQVDLALLKLQGEVDGVKEVIGYAQSLEQMKGEETDGDIS